MEYAPRKNGEDFAQVLARALKRFDAAVTPQMEIRAHALLCRRFISVPGAMWEGPWGQQFEESIKVEIDKISKGVDKIVTDYRENRIVPDFRPAGGDSDAGTADTLDGLHRADSYHFKAQQARDNAFEEAVSGGFGAYRLTNDYADPYDKDSDAQRVNPGLAIVDADQCVFFDPAATEYDKHSAEFAFVITAVPCDTFKDEWGTDAATSWPSSALKINYDFFTRDTIRVVEYYEVQHRNEKLLIFTHNLSGEEQRWWMKEIDREEIDELVAMGWQPREVMRRRRRVRKYTMTGAEVLKDHGYIAGDCIPIVPVYGKRWFVDNKERFRGFVSKLMDAQRTYNAKVSKLAEVDALAPREIPIFAPEQMPPHLANMWARQNIDRHPYALVNPLLDADGNIVAAGPIGKVEQPTLPPVTATLLQIASNDLAEETADGAEEVKANVSAEAMDIAAARVDAKSAIYLDNMRQSVQREGEIYLGMARDCYFEPGRVVETMTEDGEDGEAILHEDIIDKNGALITRNDFQRGRYKVIADVTEATATKRDKAVKSALNTAAVAVQAQDQELAQIAILTAVQNQDGEGMSDMQAYARKRLVALGVVAPNDEERAEMEAAAEQQQPDPAAQALEAQAAAFETEAQKNLAQTGKYVAETKLTEAKVVDTLASAAEKGARAMEKADEAVDLIEIPRPRIRMGRDL